jgi:hypothetical protein
LKPAAADVTVSAVKRVLAVRAHEISARAPMQVTPGEEVYAGDRDTDWPEFVFVTAAPGSGWVPARYLSQPSGDAVVETAYDTTELPTNIGDVLDVLTDDHQSGWLWCRNSAGREGWVPHRTVDPA